ncbi:MAG: hypothetical protein OXP73_11800 [Chloroflexota bacterium]|nr:hypothetical protein [Chloroflexota bacterium]
MPTADAGESWKRLRSWLRRRIDQMAADDYSRLPPSFASDDGRVASEAYSTVLIAMEVIEGRRTTPGRTRNPADGRSHATIPGPP